MGQRPGVLVTRKQNVAPMQPSASQVPVILIEIRAHWPQSATRADVLKQLLDAHDEARARVTQRFEEVK